jgi:zinc and cadmium transporter
MKGSENVENMFYAMLAVVIVSLLSFVGVFTISVDEKKLDSFLLVFVSFAAGSILGAAYFELLPEAIELVEGSISLVYITLGFVAFFFLERVIYWYHGHGHMRGVEKKIEITGDVSKASVKNFVYLNLVGDAIHNFTDGVVIATSFIIGFPVGFVTTIAAVFHEIPQEIGDFAVLVYGGLKRSLALGLNFFSAVTAVVGSVFAYFFSIYSEGFRGFIVAFAAGGFIYLAACELIPELQEEKSLNKSILQFVLFTLGIALIWSLGLIFPE